jgi:hypothetical protein
LTSGGAIPGIWKPMCSMAEGSAYRARRAGGRGAVLVRRGSWLRTGRLVMMVVVEAVGVRIVLCEICGTKSRGGFWC